jgi:hypothetical protein
MHTIHKTLTFSRLRDRKTKRQKTLVILKMVPFIGSIHKILIKTKRETESEHMNSKSNGYPES